MEEEKIITGTNVDEVMQQISQDLRQNPDLLQYRALINQQNKVIHLDIDIDLGGGFEGGFATTIFSASFRNRDNFRFALHEESFFDDLGKFFGMQDVEIGYPDFDNHLVVKTSDESRARTIFTDVDVRTTLLTLKDFTFEIILPETDTEDSILELIIEEGITDPVRLRSIYGVFFGVLNMVDSFEL